MKKPHRKNNARLADNATAQAGQGPVRRCAVTRETRPQTELLRFVLSPEADVTPDFSSKLPGRGVWLVPEKEVLSQAISKKAFAASFKTAVKVPDNLNDVVEEGLLRRCLNLLGFAKKAGHVILGFDQVRVEVRRSEPSIMLEASDGASDGRSKVLSLVAAQYQNINIFGGFTSSELGMAFGRDHVVHGCVREAPVKQALLHSYKRLAGFRETPEDGWLSSIGTIAETPRNT